jgi:CBS domain-containing protein
VLSSGASHVVVTDDLHGPVGVIEVGDLTGRSGEIAELARPLGTVLPIGSSLKSALAAMLQRDDSLLAVVNDSGYVGLLTLEGLHGAMRRSAGSPPPVE